MVLEKIDAEKSIKNKRVYRKNWLVEKVIDFLMNLLFILIFPFFAYVYLKKSLKTDEISFAILLFTFTLVITVLFLYALLNINKLRKIKGLSPKENKKIITNIFDTLDWQIYRNNIQFTQATLDWNWCSCDYGKEIVILYENESILINCVSYGRGDLKLFTHWFINRKKENEIIKEFEKQIKMKIEKQTNL
jgi:hypothetical protein